MLELRMVSSYCWNHRLIGLVHKHWETIKVHRIYNILRLGGSEGKNPRYVEFSVNRVSIIRIFGRSMIIKIIGLSIIRKKRENFDEIREESIRLFRGQNHTSFRSTAYSKSTIASAGLKSSSRIRYSTQPDIGILATKIGKFKPEVGSGYRKWGP